MFLLSFLNVFFLPSTFLELLVARSVSWQETLYMYKYISTYKGRFCLFLYLCTWYVQSLLTYVFFAAWVPYGFLWGFGTLAYFRFWLKLRSA